MKSKLMIGILALAFLVCQGTAFAESTDAFEATGTAAVVETADATTVVEATDAAVVGEAADATTVGGATDATAVVATAQAVAEDAIAENEDSLDMMVEEEEAIPADELYTPADEFASDEVVEADEEVEL